MEAVACLSAASRPEADLSSVSASAMGGSEVVSLLVGYILAPGSASVGPLTGIAMLLAAAGPGTAPGVPLPVVTVRALSDPSRGLDGNPCCAQRYAGASSLMP